MSDAFGPDACTGVCLTRSDLSFLIVTSFVRVADRSPEAHERYLKRYTTVVSVSAGSGVGSPYISHEWRADSLRFAAIHFRIASYASFMGL